MEGEVSGGCYPHSISSWCMQTSKVQLWKEYEKGPTKFIEGNSPHGMVGARAWLISNWLKNKIPLVKLVIQLGKVPCPGAVPSLESG